MNTNNMNLDENTMNNIKNMVDNGNLNDAISQISPEMIQNFSKMFNQSQGGTPTGNTNTSNTSNTNSVQENRQNAETSSSSNQATANNPLGNFDFSKLDMSSIMKMSSAFGGGGNKNDPRGNLLSALKPYLREGKKDKVDQYVNLLNMTKIADMMKNNPMNQANNNKESNHD